MLRHLSVFALEMNENSLFLLQIVFLVSLLSVQESFQRKHLKGNLHLTLQSPEGLIY